MADKIVAMFAYPATLVILPGVSKFFIKSPGLPVRAQNLPANTYRGLFQKCFINFIISENIKKENKKRTGFSALVWAVLDRKKENI